MTPYTQLTHEQRYQIQALMKAGKNHTEIAGIIGVHKMTISREVRRNTGRRGYRPVQAPYRSLNLAPCQTSAARRLEPRADQPLVGPGSRPGRQSRNHYQHVLTDKQAGGTLYRHLRCRKPRRKRYGARSRRGQIPEQVAIGQRPAIVGTGRRFGDWEVDTVIGKRHRQPLVTREERKSKLTLIAKVVRKAAGAVAEAIIGLLKPLSPWVHTISADNRREFFQHQRIAHALNAKFYFPIPAHPGNVV